jgi:transcriptional regulator with XRE-family HTH domain
MDKRMMPQSPHYCQTCRFDVHPGHFKRHTFSVVHRKAKLIRAMLERNCITQADIARRIGVSRERVRQLARQLGFADGRSRHAICRLERRKQAMAEFFVEAQKRGFPVEPLSARRGYINGKLCVQRQACWHDLEQGQRKYTYLSIHTPSGQFDICAWKLPDGRFLILPRKLAAFRQTTFNPEESERFGTFSSSHHYREYIERWSVLGQPRPAK